MWDFKEIKEKKKYVQNRLKNCDNQLEQAKLMCTLLAYIAMSENRGTKKFVLFTNFIDVLSNGKYSLIRNNIISNKYQYSIKQKMNEEYYNFLLNLCYNVGKTKTEINEINIFNKISSEPKEIIQVCKKFYKSLGDDEIYKCAKDILNNEKNINFSKYYRLSTKHYNGITYNDYIFNESYFSIYLKDEINDFVTLNHEIMHGIDFKMNQKIPSKNYHGFQEVAPYFIEYLFIDYLENNNYSMDEIQRLKIRKEEYIQNLSILTIFALKSMLNIERINDYNNDLSYDKVKNILTPKIIDQLLEVESGILSYALYKDYKQNNNFNKLKEIIMNSISPNSIPDFSKFGFSNEYLCELGSEIGNYSKPKKLII